MPISYVEKALSFCHYIVLLYEEDPIKVKFSVSRNEIKFFLYYNPTTFENVDEFNDEINAGLRSYDLLREGMGDFYSRISKIEGCLNYKYCWEYISLNSNVIDTT